MPKESVVLIKLHPNETKQIEKDLCGIINKNAKECYTISADINIPVEFYLQYLKIYTIAHFMSSTIFYSGYIYEQCRTQNLFLDFYERCREKGINMDNLNGLYMAAIKYEDK